MFYLLGHQHILTLVTVKEERVMRVSLWGVRRRKRVFLKYLAIIVVIMLILVVLLWGIYQLFREDTEIRITGDTVRIHLLLHETNEVIQLGLEEYVVGVVAGEMPASFPLEALKAQAVAARTYAVKRLQAPDPRIKSLAVLADLSSDPVLNQAWISCEEMKNRWGLVDYHKYKKKIIQAVEETRGKVIIYGGEIIDPVYHASCGGVGTENSEDVWKYSIPYLRRVECANHPAANQEAVHVFGAGDLNRLLGTALPVLSAAKTAGGKQVIEIKEKSASGRVKKLQVGGLAISGSEFRSKLGLPSTWFDLQVDNNQVKLTTRGHGHAVGMCQYGAAALAGEGKSYEKILTHYYTGVKLASIKS